MEYDEACARERESSEKQKRSIRKREKVKKLKKYWTNGLLLWGAV
jgi:hypothetical protein